MDKDDIEKISKLYESQGYFDKYGGSVFVAIFTITIMLGLIGYFYVMGNLRKLRENWTLIRCSPQYIPFAGIIRPEAGKTTFQSTSDNFTMCSNEILSKIAKYETMPANYSVNVVSDMMNGVNDVMNTARNEMSELRTMIGKIFLEIYRKIESMIVPIHIMFLKQKDMLAKSQGVFTTILYTFLSAYLSLRTFIKAFLNIIILALIVFAAMIAILFLGFFSIPVAIALTIVFVAVAVPVSVVAIWAETTLAMTSPKIPKTPHAGPFCFEKSTPLRVYRPRSWFSKEKVLKTVPMCKVKPGDRIYNFNYGSKLPDRVTATFELDGQYSGMVRIHGIRMSGNHYVIWNGNEMKPHFENGLKIIDTISRPLNCFTSNLTIGNAYPAEVIAKTLNPKGYRDTKKYHRLYCVNTISKMIMINSRDQMVVALDWDDIDDSRIQHLLNYVNRIQRRQYEYEQLLLNMGDEPTTPRYVSKVVPQQAPVCTKYNLEWIHKYLQSGFHENSQVRVSIGGQTKKISKIRVGDRIVVPMVQTIKLGKDYGWNMKYVESCVMGRVKIDTEGLDVYTYHWKEQSKNNTMKERTWVGAPNCMRYIRSTEHLDRMDNKRYDSTFEWTENKHIVAKKPKYLYHLITACGLILVNNVVMYDYNGGIDNILGNTKLFIPRGC